MKPVYALILMVLAVAACNRTEKSANDMGGADGIDENKTKEVLDHHWTAFKANDLEETMKDYAEESVLITPNATYRGLDEIRNNFVNAFKMFPSDSTTFTLDKSIVVQDVGYILWKSKTPAFNLTYATDTFIIRDGKIVRQTYAGVAE
ncbi:MAG TPA: nuclear transport factor 2 family protein [Chryseosolibacter sp.]